MASNRVRPLETFSESSSDQGIENVRINKEEIARLRAQLEAQRQYIKQLRREKSLEVRQVRELEHNRSSVAVKELRLKLLDEKSRDLDRQKEILNRKFETELQKVVKQKESDLHKTQNDLQRCQDEIKEVTRRGLSGTARGAFEAERAKLLADTKDLRSVKKKLEESLQAAQEADKQKAFELRKVRESQRGEIAKVRKEADIQMRRLLDELKSKDRAISQIERESGTKAPHFSSSDKASSVKNMMALTKETDSWEKTASGKLSDSLDSDDLSSGYDTLSMDLSLSSESSSSEQRLLEIQGEVQRLEECCSTLKQEKSNLEKKVEDLEQKNGPIAERNRHYFERNKELTSTNRDLASIINSLNGELEKLREELCGAHEHNEVLEEEVEALRMDHATFELMAMDMGDMRTAIVEQDNTIVALTKSCQEKDRRIEILAQRKRQRRISQSSQKKVVRFMLPATVHILTKGSLCGRQTECTFDDDASVSTVSKTEVSAAANMTTESVTMDINTDDNNDDDVFDQVSHEEMLHKFQRLCKEHTDLQRLHALLQAQTGGSTIDPERENKNRLQLQMELIDAQGKIDDLERSLWEREQDQSWVDEKEFLNLTLKSLRDKLSSEQTRYSELQHSLRESGEKNEDLEFRNLELEETSEKLLEEAKHSVTYSVPPVLLNDTVLQLMSKEMGMETIEVQQLKQKLEELQYHKDVCTDREVKLTVVQSRALLDAVCKKLREVTEEREDLLKRIKQLESEKVDLLSAATGVSADIVLEYEETRSHLQQAQLKIRQLEKDVEELHKADAIHRYKADASHKLEEKYKQEIETLRRQLTSLQQGREYETEIIFKDVEKKLGAIEEKNYALLERVEELQCENQALVDQLCMTETDQDTYDLLDQLKTKVGDLEKSELELMEKNTGLSSEVVSLFAKLAEQENIEATLTDTNFRLQEEIELSREKCGNLELDLESANLTIGDLKQETESMTHRVIDLASQLRMTRLQCKNAIADQKDATKGKCESMEQQLEGVEGRCLDLRGEMLDTRVKCGNLLEELETVKEELNISRKACLEYEDNLKAARENSSELENYLDKAGEQCSELKNVLEATETENSEKYAALQRELDELKEKHTKAQEELQHFKDELVLSNNTVDQSTTIQNSISAELAQANEKCSMLEKSVEEMKNQGKEKEAKDQCNTLAQELAEQRNNTVETTSSNTQTECVQIIGANTQTEETVSSINDLISNGQKLQTQVLALMESVSKKEEEIEKLNNRLQIHITSSERELTELQEMYQTVETERDGLLSDRKASEHVEQLQEQIKELNEVNQQQMVAIQALQEAQHELHQSLVELHDKEDTYLHQISEYSSLLEDRRKTITSLEEQINQLEEDLRESRTTGEAALCEVATLEGRIAELDEGRIKKLAEFEQVNILLEAETKSKTHLESQVQEFQAEVQDIQDRLQDAHTELDRLQFVNSDLYNQLNQSESRENQLQAQIVSFEDTKKEVSELKQDIAENEEQKKSLYDQLHVTESKLIAAEKRELRHRDEIAEIKEEKEQVLSQIEELIVSEKSQRTKAEGHLAELKAVKKNFADDKVRYISQIEWLELSENSLKNRLNDLHGQLKLANDREAQTQEQIAWIKEEKARRIEFLQEQLDQSEQNEIKLSETIAELEEVEQELKDKISLYESSEFGPERIECYQALVQKLKDSEQNLMDRLEQMEGNESLLRHQLAEMERQLDEEVNNKSLAEELGIEPIGVGPCNEVEEEDAEEESLSYQESSPYDTAELEELRDQFKQEGSAEQQQQNTELEALSDEDDTSSNVPKDLKGCRQKIEKLQNRIEGLKIIESKLLEEIYQLKLENQELQEHNEQLQDTAEDEPDAGEQLSKLQDENAELKDQLLKAKLDAATEENNTQKMSELEEQVTTLSHFEQDLKEQLKHAENENIKLQSELKQACDQKTNQEEELQKQVEEANLNCKNLEDQVRQFEASECELKQNLKEKSNETEELGKKIEEANQNCSDLKKKVHELEISENTLNEALEKLQIELENARLNCKNLEDQMQQYECSECELKQNLEEKCKEAKQLAKQLDEARLNCTNLEDQIQQFKTSESKLKSALEQKSTMAEELAKQVEDSNNTCKDLSDKVYELEAMEALAEVTVKQVIEEKTSDTEELQKQIEDSDLACKDLKDHICELESANADLKQALQEKSNHTEELLKHVEDSNISCKNLKDEINELQQNEQGLLKKILELEDIEQQLNEKLMTLGTREQELLYKVEILEETKAQLGRQSEFVKSNEGQFTQEIKRLREDKREAQQLEDSLRSKIKEFESREAELKETVKELEDGQEDLKSKSAKTQEKNASELKHLQQKVEILVNTEEKLVDRLHKRDEAQEELKKEAEGYKKDLEEAKKTSNALQTEVENKERKVKTLEEECEGKDKSEQKVIALESFQREIQMQMQKVEKSESLNAQKIKHLESMVEQYEKMKESYQSTIREYEKSDSELKNKLDELEEVNTALKTKMRDLEAQNEELVDTVEIMSQRHARGGVRASTELNGTLDDSMIPSIEDHLEPHSRSTQLIAIHTVPVEVYHHQFSVLSQSSVTGGMTQQQMISRVHELESMEKYYKKKNQELQDNLDSLRSHVEVVTTAVETDAGIPTFKLKPGIKETEFEAKVQELVKSEAVLRTKLIDMENKHSKLRLKLEEKEYNQEKLEKEHRYEVEKIESKLLQLQKSEARLRTKCDLNGPAHEDRALAKLQKLDARVFDLESSERSLKRHVKELENSKYELNEKLQEATHTKHDTVQLSVSQKDRYAGLLHELQLIKTTDRDLKDKLSALAKEDNSQLLQKITQLECREKSLQKKLDMYENLDNMVTVGNSSVTLDAPESVLKQRLQQMEKLQIHLKQQIIELEKDSEEMHSMSRRDKCTVQEQNVLIKELQLQERTLKDQLHGHELRERQLHSELDQAKDTITELEKLVAKLKASETQLNSQYEGSKNSHENLMLDLDSLRQKIQMTDSSYQRSTEDHDRDRQTLTIKLEGMSFRVKELEGNETALKEKTQELESRCQTLKERTSHLEMSESILQKRTGELENKNEQLLKVKHSLEEEKATMLYELSDVSVDNGNHIKELNALKEKLKENEKVLSTEGQIKGQIEQRLDDLTLEGVQLQKRIMKHEATERELKQSLSDMRNKEKQLLDQVKQLEADMTAEKDKSLKRQDCEKDNTALRYQLEDEQFKVDVLDGRNAELEDSLERCKLSTPRDGLVSVPRVKLDQLVAQTTQLAHTKAQLQNREVKLNQALCQLAELQGVSRARVDVANRHTQAHLANSFTLRQVSNEFKHALRLLGSKYPEAYHEFAQALHAPSSKGTVIDHSGTTIRTPQPQGRTMSGPTYITVRDGGAYQRSPSREEDIRPVSAVAENGSSHARGDYAQMGETRVVVPRPIDVANLNERTALIDQLVDVLPNESEEPFWQRVESHSLDHEPATTEEGYWADIERSIGETDDLTISFMICDVETDDSCSTQPPPLPSTNPPLRRLNSPGLESFYLPSPHPEDLSADEAPEIDNEDDGALPRSKSSTPGPYMRARTRSRSREPNQSLSLRKGVSMESLADSGLSTMRSDEARRGLEEIAMLRGKLATLEVANQDKERELDTVKSSKKHLEETLRQHGDVNTLKQEMLDKTHQVELDKQIIKELETQNIQLKQELEIKAREMTHLYAQVDTLEKSIRAKDSYRESSQNLEVELATAKLDHENKTRKLKIEENEVDRLTGELRRCELDRQTAQDRQQRAERQLNQAEYELQQARETASALRDLEHKHLEILNKYDDLLKQQQDVSVAVADRSALETIILKLRGQLRDLEKVDVQRQQLESRLRDVEKRLAVKTKVEDELTRDNISMKHKFHDLSEELTKLRAIQFDYQKLRNKILELEKLKTKAQTLVTPLRAKVMRFAQKCKSKDELISRLTHELRRHGEPAELLAEADRVTQHTASEEYSRPLSPLTRTPGDTKDLETNTEVEGFEETEDETSKLRKSIYRRFSIGPNSDLIDGEDVDAMIEQRLANGVVSQPTNSVPATSSSRPKMHMRHSAGIVLDSKIQDILSLDMSKLSVEDLLNKPSPLSINTSLPPSSTNSYGLVGRGTTERSNGSPEQKAKILPQTGVFRVAQDFKPELADPRLLSRRGEHTTHLPLSEGDTVRVIGSMDDQGYFEAVVKGRRGLVPASHLQPVYPTVSHRRKHRPLSYHVDSSPEEILSLKQDLKQCHVPNHNVPYVSSATLLMKGRLDGSDRSSGLPSLPPGGGSLNKGHTLPRSTFQTPMPDVVQSGPPEPPSNFAIQRRVGSQGMLLSWTPPFMDEVGRSNGCQVTAYKIYINNRDKQKVTSPYMCKALVERLDLSKPLRFSIQTLGEGGHQASRLVEVLYEAQKHREPAQWDQSDAESLAGDGVTTETSSVQSISHAEGGERRVFLAVYDYDPSKHSPENFPSKPEIAFKTGDIVTTYGSIRDDGFYHAKCHGKRGLVPSSFIEEVAVLKSRGKQSGSSSSVIFSQYPPSTTSKVSSSCNSVASGDSRRPPQQQQQHTRSATIT